MYSELMLKRYSSRQYSDKKVEDEKLQKILEAAVAAPTACNNQPFKLLVIKSNEGLNKLKKASNTYDAPLAIIVCADHDSCWKRAFDNKKSAEIDASIVTDHMMMQATELGLGTVWICSFNPDILFEEFNIPKNLEPVNILIIGYASGEPNPRHFQRKTVEEILINETF